MRWPGGSPTRTATAIIDHHAAFRPQGRVAVFQPRPGLGDLIWHLPIIRAIAGASQSGQVTLVTKPSTQADTLLADDPAIERIVWFDRNPRQSQGGGRGRHDGPLGTFRLVAQLRACHADSCVLLHHGASLAACLALAGIPHRYGYGYTRLQRVWLNHGPHLGNAAPFTEAFDQAAAFARAAGLWPLPEPAIAVQPAAVQAARAWLGDVARPLAILGIGGHGADRQWGAARFAALGGWLLGSGYGTVLPMAAAHEADLAQAVCLRLPQDRRVRPVVGQSLSLAAALLADAEMFVGNDSGLMNLRAATGRTAYALFGASGPLSHSAHIRSVVPPTGPRSGMGAITVDQVTGLIAAP